METARTFDARAGATARTAFGAPMHWAMSAQAYRRAGWDRAQRLPDPLGGRAPPIERQIDPERGRLNVADHRGHRMRKSSSPPSSCAVGKQSWYAGTSASGASRRRMAQMPLSVAATRIEHSEHSPMAKQGMSMTARAGWWVSCPIPPRL